MVICSFKESTLFELNLKYKKISIEISNLTFVVSDII